MNVIIFEGVDNLGKSTLINNIANRYKDTRDIVFMHATGPKNKEGESPAAYQKRAFQQAIGKCNYIANTEHIYDTSKKNIVFMDRSHYGEYVYGQIYRGSTSDEILTMFKNIRYSLYNIIVVHLEASAEFVVSHDDNKSFTSDYDPEKRIKTVQREIDLFNECFEKVKPRYYIKINVEGSDNNYRNIDELTDEILSKIKECVEL